MIYLYGIDALKGKDDLFVFLEKKGFAYELLSKEDLLKSGEPLEKDVRDHLLSQSAIFFSEDMDEALAEKLLNAFDHAGLSFTYKVKLSAESEQKGLLSLLYEHSKYQDLLKKVTYLQKMIDGSGRLKESDYDPDLWSELKLAIASANDYLDALFSEDAEAFSDISEASLEKRTEDLRKAMKNIVSK